METDFCQCCALLSLQTACTQLGRFQGPGSTVSVDCVISKGSADLDLISADDC